VTDCGRRAAALGSRTWSEHQDDQHVTVVDALEREGLVGLQPVAGAPHQHELDVRVDLQLRA